MLLSLPQKEQEACSTHGSAFGSPNSQGRETTQGRDVPAAPSPAELPQEQKGEQKETEIPKMRLLVAAGDVPV